MKKDNELVQQKMLGTAFIPLAIAFNVGIGLIIKALNFPLYLDSVGTILATLMLGWRSGAIVGVLGFVITAVFFNPLAIYFIGTQIAIAVYVDITARRGWYRNFLRSLLAGSGLGIVAAIVSAPVIILVFQGATGNGASLITAFLVKTGHKIIESIFIAGISIEPIDKAIQVIIAFFLLKSMPVSLLQKFNTGSLKVNNFIR